VVDKSSQMVLSALSKAVADPGGLPLHGRRSAPGLFPATSSGKQAARRCLDEGFLRPVEPEAVKPRCVITDKGVCYLLAQVSPRQVLEDFVRVLEARQAQFDGLLVAAREAGAGLDALRTNAERVLQVVARAEKPASLSALFNSFRGPACGGCHPPDHGMNGIPAPDAALLTHLTEWQESGAAEDCPLPDLYRACAAAVPGVSVGCFHDALRRLQHAERIYLHPWTGPLYDLPEPPFALLVGHEVAYYANARS
jgi:hypothetical protein